MDVFCFMFNKNKHWVGDGHRTISNNLMRLSLPFLKIELPIGAENVGKFRAIFPLTIWSHRWNMCVEWTNKKMGMAVGSLFVQDHFNHESKVVALEMIHGIREGELRMLSTFIL